MTARKRTTKKGPAALAGADGEAQARCVSCGKVEGKGLPADHPSLENDDGTFLCDDCNDARNVAEAPDAVLANAELSRLHARASGSATLAPAGKKRRKAKA